MTLTLEKALEENALLKARVEELEALINNPEMEDFINGVKLESAHQTERWGKQNEEQKPPHHYTMVANKLLGKLCESIWNLDSDKFQHHCITLAAAMHNAHRQIKTEGSVIQRWFDGDFGKQNY